MEKKSHRHLVPRTEKWQTIKGIALAGLFLVGITVLVVAVVDWIWPSDLEDYDMPVWMRVVIGALFVLFLMRGREIKAEQEAKSGDFGDA